MEVEKIVPEDKTSSGYPIFIYIVIIIFIVILILVIFGNYIVKPSNHYGTWSNPRAGPCIRTTSDCQGPGVQEYISVCIPNSVTSQGCPDENGTPTYAPKVWKESCTPVCHYSNWDIINSGCSDEGISTTTYTCVQKDPTGINNCMRIITQVESTGVFHTPVFYDVGESYSIEFSCNPQIQHQGTWMAGTLNNSAFTSTPILGGNYQISDQCSSAEETLAEGMVYSPMKCVNYNIQTNTYTIVPDSECQSELTECYSYLPTLEDNPNSSSIICPGVISDIPYYAYPCRYRPQTSIDYGSPDINVVSNHYILALVDGEVLLPGQAPNNLYTYVPLSDQGTSQELSLQSVPMVVASQVISGCTPEEVNFNSGAFLYFAIREVLSPSQFICIIGAYVAGRYQGWLQIKTTSTGKNYLMWEQGQLSFSQNGSPGILSTEASQILVTVGNRNTTPVPGYRPNVGTIQMKLETLDGNTLHCQTLNLDSYIQLNNLTSILFPVNTENCSASLRGAGTCSMYSITSGVYVNQKCPTNK